MKKRIIIVAIAVLLIISIPITNLIIKEVKYNNAVDYAKSGNYEQAAKTFYELDDYKYCDVLSDYCYARVAYNEGDYESAYNLMLGTYIYADKELSDEISELHDILDKKHNEKLKSDIKQQESKEKEKALNGIPFVGMSADYLCSTKLGDWGDYFTNRKIVNGELEEYEVYCWYSKNGILLMRASVEHYTVTNVSKFNEDSCWNNDNLKPGIVPGGTKKAKSNKKYQTTTFVDKYNVNDYSNEEDFYDDHYDDFLDYYDAEDYYKEHHK